MTGRLSMTGNGGYGRGQRVTVGKSAVMAPPSKDQAKNKRLAQIGLAGNAVAITGGLHALKVTADQPASRKLFGLTPKVVKPSSIPKVRSAKAAGAIAAGWLGLHGVELTSDAISNRALQMQYRDANAGLPKKPIAKAQRQDHSGAMVGSGAVVGGVGLVGGGVPRVKANRIMVDVKNAPTRPAQAANLVRAYRGGEFGYRHNAHHTFRTFGLADPEPKGRTRIQHFTRGEKAGRRATEDTIVRHLHRGRVGSNIALGTGAALVGTGLYQHHQAGVVGKRSSSFRNDAVIGAGATTAVGAGGLSLGLDSQGRKWAKRAATHIDAAQKINPNLGGHLVKPGRGRVPNVVPERNTGLNTKEGKRVFAGRTNAATEAAGRLRGAASQERYFANTYGSVARPTRMIGAAGALVAAAGLRANHQRNSRPRRVGKVWKPRLSMKPVRASEEKYRSATRAAELWDKPPSTGAMTSTSRKATPGQVEAQRRNARYYAVKQRTLAAGHLADARKGKARVVRDRRIVGAGAAGASTLAGGYEVTKVATTMSDADANRIAARYDTRGPLPKHLSRPQKMKAYEGRYIAAGGKKAEKWQHRAAGAEVGRNVGLATATTAAAGLLARRGKRTGALMARTPGIKRLTERRLETTALGAGLGGGWSELYGEHARSRRASYQGSPAGVAASALTRMQNYTKPPKVKP